MTRAPDLREIRAFLAVAEEMHFARAAERLVLTASRVSQTIKSLEARVGGRLFDRTSRHTALATAPDARVRSSAWGYGKGTWMVWLRADYRYTG